MHVVMDNVIGGLTIWFNAAKNIAEKFSFLWKYLTIPPDEMKEKSKSLVDQYPDDIIDDLIMEMRHLPTVHLANFGDNQLSALELLNCLRKYKLEGLFPNVCVCLGILLTIPATVASAERSFSKLKEVKNFLRPTMTQGRLVDLSRLSIEAELAKKVNFDEVIRRFARKKARKAPLFSRRWIVMHYSSMRAHIL